MSDPLELVDSPAPLFGRRRDRTPHATYWKCQVGRRIHLARERTNLSRDAFACEIGISSRRLWEIENGILAIEASEIALIADAFGIHPGALFDDTSFDVWLAGRSTTSPIWILAHTIGQLPKADRDLIEYLVIRLDEKFAGHAA
jgi:transcriptional regulator with XRE-family HTH domain